MVIDQNVESSGLDGAGKLSLSYEPMPATSSGVGHFVDLTNLARVELPAQSEAELIGHCVRNRVETGILDGRNRGQENGPFTDQLAEGSGGVIAQETSQELTR